MGFKLTCKGIQPQREKCTAIGQIAPPKTRKELRRFVGMVNYYREMWVRQCHLLATLTLTDRTSKQNKFGSTEVHQKSFDKIKKIIRTETLLRYTD